MDNEKTIELGQLIQEKYDNIAGIVVLKDDQIAYENYFDGYDKNNTIQAPRRFVWVICTTLILLLYSKAVTFDYYSSYYSEK